MTSIVQDAIQSIQARATPILDQDLSVREGGIKTQIDNIKQKLSIVNDFGKSRQNINYSIYLKELFVSYLYKKYSSYFNDNNQIIKNDMTSNVRELDNYLTSQQISITNSDNFILLPIKNMRIQHPASNVLSGVVNSDVLNYIVKPNWNDESVFRCNFKNNNLKIYKDFTKIDSINKIYELLNLNNTTIDFQNTKFYTDILGDNSLFSQIGSEDNTCNNLPPNSVSDPGCYTIYLKIDFENNDCEDFENMEYINFILQKYNLTEKDLDDKINKNKELILIEQNKYNIKMQIFKILKYISIILIILLIFIIGYYSIGKNKIMNTFKNSTKNSSKNSSRNLSKNKSNVKINNSKFGFIKKNNVKPE